MKIILSLFLLSGISCAKVSGMADDGSQGGRFRLLQLGDMRRDQYMIDTHSGRLWRPACTNVAKNGVDCLGEVAFVPVTVVDLEKAGPAK